MRWMIAALATVASLAAGLVAPSAARAAGQAQAVAALHVAPNNHKGLPNFCNDVIGLPCDRFLTTWPIHAGANVYLVAARADSALGVSGVSFGITYQGPGTQSDGMGMDLFGYMLCGDLESRQSGDGDPSHVFPASGGGNRILWDATTNCQRGVVNPYGVEAVTCVFYVYAYDPDQFAVTPNPAGPNGPEFQVTDCVGPTAWDLEWPSHAGVIGFGMDGYNPCTAPGVPVEATTWGRLKSQYR